jgi:hypothetical protein
MLEEEAGSRYYIFLYDDDVFLLVFFYLTHVSQSKVKRSPYRWYNMILLYI